MKTIEILIVTRSVFLQQGLGALLESPPQISRVKAVKDLQDAHTLIAEHRPNIVLLDETLLDKDPKPALEKSAPSRPKRNALCSWTMFQKWTCWSSTQKQF